MKRAFLALAFGAAVLAGCDNPQMTIDSLRKDITELSPGSNGEEMRAKMAKIDDKFAKLESQITALEQRGDPKADEFKRQLASLRGEYQAKKMLQAVQDAKNAIQSVGEALRDTAKGVEDAFKKSDSDNE
jgi:uncharacterized protein YukE/predicted small secreted protein